jgi:hypothetical protein
MPSSKKESAMQNDPTLPILREINSAGKVRSIEDPLDPGKPEKWWDAQQRLLLYLQALEIPADRSLEMVLTALRRAMADFHWTQSPNITGLAMRSLRNVLADEGLDCLRQTFCSSGNFHKPGSDRTLPLSSDTCAMTPGYGEVVFSTGKRLPVMPPLSRSTMHAEFIERSLLHSLVYRILHKSKKGSVDKAAAHRRR